MVTATTVLLTINKLAASRGEKKGQEYYLEVTTAELLEAFELLPSATHHRHIKGVVEMHYPKTTSEVMGRGDGSNGFKLNLRIWSK